MVDQTIPLKGLGDIPEKPKRTRSRPADKRPSTSVPAVTKKALSTTVGLLNGIVAMFAPLDALGKIQFADQVIDEQEMLVDALIETQATHPLFRRYLGRFVGVAGQASLIGAVGLIVYVRLERRGMVPSFAGGAPPAVEPQPISEEDFWVQKEWERNHPEPEPAAAEG